MGHCDAFLDSIGWSGCNSALESLPHNLPFITIAGNLMRGRHVAAILEMMGITETIASTLDDYVAIATRIANDQDARGALSRRIAENKERLYRDRTCIRFLEDFLDQVARQPPAQAL
jgi:predicted O-linked N-acetylglucosamine transferase (SPINDLY family)